MGLRVFWCALLVLALAVGLTACGGGSSSSATVPTQSTGPTSATAPATSPTGTTSATGAGTAAAALAADQAAETLARAANAAALNYATNNSGSYAGLSPAALQSATPSIQVGPGSGNPYIATPNGVSVLDGGAGFTVTATSTSGDTFSIGESATGTSTQTCSGTASSACTGGAW